MSNIETKYENWKNKLLDLGRGNKLMNFKETKTTFKITYPDCFDLYESFVINENPIIFPMVDDNRDEDVDIISDHDEIIEDELNNSVEDYDYFDSNIRTNKTVKELQRSLRSLRNKAKTANEEQGVNFLYLVFGFLNWTEASHSDYEYRSPLLLVPVSLTIESITSPYKLTLHEDEIVVNPTLAYKLSNDFGITLPTYDESKTLAEFFDEIKKCIKPNKWNVIEEVSIGILSFLKINMYTDLKTHKDAILSNPIVRALGGETTSVTNIPDGLLNFDFDVNEKPKDVFQVVDADGSQQEAILLAKNGVSFVLQGPPGTGKSQTITNIIAESLANGKKILFVSEKMAALDVVHKRLSAAELNDFCLVLHSNKANKRNVLDQLEKSLKLSYKKSSISDDALNKLNMLQADKKKLNDYANQLFTSVEPLGKTIFEVNGIIANLETVKDVIFDIPSVEKTTRDQFDNYDLLIRQFAATIGKMTEDYKSNPWQGSNLSAVSNEFRHDSSAKLPKLIEEINKLKNTVSEIFEETGVGFDLSLSGIEKAMRLFRTLSNAREIPSIWILGNDVQPLFEEVAEQMRIQEACCSKAQNIAGSYGLLVECGLLNEITSESIKDKNVAKSESNTIKNILGTLEPFCVWNKVDIEIVKQHLVASKDKALEFSQIQSELLERFEDSIFSINHEEILTRIKTEYNSAFKAFKKSYKEDRKTIQACCRKLDDKISGNDLFNTIESLHRLSEIKKWFAENSQVSAELFGTLILNETTDYDLIERNISAFYSLKELDSLYNDLLDVYSTIDKNEDLMFSHYCFMYKGISTDWSYLRESIEWAVIFRKVVESTKPANAFIEKVCESKEYDEVCFAYLHVLAKAVSEVTENLNWYLNCFESKEIFKTTLFDNLLERINSCNRGLFLLEEWIDFKNARTNCVKNGLESFINAIDEENLETGEMWPIFKKRFFRLWLDAILPNYPAVLNFRRKMQDITVSEFASLDKLQFEIAKARIKNKLINDLPSADHFTSGNDEISILKRELSKQRKIMPIRKLFKAIPNLLTTLKPCLMMSPLSVSLFLEADSYKFDIVIFDEASQVYTENAIGAISRGKQVVIAGDSKQLPPTSFFKASLSESDYDSEEDDDYDYEIYDSVLDEASVTLPERTLMWHYRSRHESLIAFSNAKIYKNNLITFPSNMENVKNNGIEYVYVQEGYYDRGGRKGNVIEAKKVAELVFEHFKVNPQRSLGVIAFGEVQQMAIENELQTMRLADQTFEELFSEEKEDAFFVKSLENVQGDERDTIIFSIGYAKDINGKMYNNFGPLGKAGGERRLNVAITRAKYNVKLVGSLLPTDINIDSISSEGPKLLRAYIDYALNGPSVLDRELTVDDVVTYDSPFEESVYNFLDRKGYKLSTQVGCSGYRIDMAVKHPELSGIYVLGIECDGASYHSARTARERDRLRQDVLENMGWKIYRIWSTDWIKDPITEGEKLVAAVEEAISNYGKSETPKKEAKLNEDSFVKVENKSPDDYNPINAYGFSPVEKYDYFTEAPRNSIGYLPVQNCIPIIVKHEYPIHFDLLCRRLLPLYNREKVTNVVRDDVAKSLNYCSSSVIRVGDYLYPVDYREIPVRWPNNRSIEHISEEELSTAMFAILKTMIGPTRESLIDETSRVYGFSRTGPNIKKAMNNAIINLRWNKKCIEEIEGKIRIIKG